LFLFCSLHGLFFCGTLVPTRGDLFFILYGLFFWGLLVGGICVFVGGLLLPVIAPSELTVEEETIQRPQVARINLTLPLEHRAEKAELDRLAKKVALDLFVSRQLRKEAVARARRRPSVASVGLGASGDGGIEGDGAEDNGGQIREEDEEEGSFGYMDDDDESSSEDDEDSGGLPPPQPLPPFHSSTPTAEQKKFYWELCYGPNSRPQSGTPGGWSANRAPPTKSM